MKQQYCLYISICLFLFNCNNNNSKLEKKIEIEISKTCKLTQCTIDLSKVTPFKWSKFYVFKETASLETVEKAINQSYPYFEDIGRRLIFLDEDNNIIYHEDIFPSVEGLENGYVAFHMPDSVNFRIYTMSNFTVRKRELENGYYYILSQ